MLRRNSSRNKHRRPLSRSKSTTSVSPTQSRIRELGIIDPEIAERDALIAALRSFHGPHREQSGNMQSTLRNRSSIAFSESESTSQSAGRSMRRSDSVTDRQECSPAAPGLHRQQSVRFTGPSARPGRKLASRASDSRASYASGRQTNRILEDLDERPDSTLSFAPSRSGMNSLTRRYLRSMQNTGPSSDADSLQSAHRKLRKSRSMFTSSSAQGSEYCFHNDKPKQGRIPKSNSRFASLNSENKENEPPADASFEEPQLRASLRAPKSMSYLQNRREQTTSRKSSRAENDLAVQLARDKFRQQVQEQARIKSHPSLLLRSRSKRNESFGGLRKSLRDSSLNSAALSSTFSTDTIHVPKHGSLRKTARKVSRNLKTKIKGLFTKPKNSDDPEDQGKEAELEPEPEPELEAEAEESRESDAKTSLHTDDFPPPEEASMSQVGPQIPSLHAASSNQQMKSRQGSLESVGSGDQHCADDKSRVTSWTDSITNTVVSHGSSGDRERPRLSVIKENGLQSSSSSMRSTTGRMPVGYRQTLPPGPIVDSQRVFSALMKRLEDAKREEEEEQEQEKEKEEERQRERSTKSTVKSYGALSLRSSPSAQLGSPNWASSTIRCVQPEDDDDVFQDRKRAAPVRKSIVEEKPKQEQSCLPPKATSGSPNTACDASPNVKDGYSPGKRAFGTYGAFDHPRPLTHRSSAFFASPTCHLFRTASPYRRALQESMRQSREMEQAEAPPGTNYLGSLSTLNLPTRRPSPAVSDQDPRTPYADSIYSCATTKGERALNKKDATPLVEKFPEPPSKNAHGDVTIFVDQAPYQASTSHTREFSTASSVEWKTWLSANVSKLETPGISPKPFPGPQELSIFKRGHVRELAEIESSSDILSPATPPPAEAKNRSPLNQIANNKGPSKITQSLVRKFSGRSIVAHGNENEAPPSSGSISRRSRLHAVPSMSLFKSSFESKTPDDTNGLPRMRSLNTLGHLNFSREEALLKRRSRTRLDGGPGSSAKSSPGLTAAVERQFGQANTGSPSQRFRWNFNNSPSPLRLGQDASKNNAVGAGAIRPELSPQAMGSKRIVDVFLNSRRRRIQDTGSGSGSSPAAFI